MLAPTLFNTCMDWVLGRVAYGTGCGASAGDVMILTLHADDAVLFAEPVVTLIEALEKLSEESEPLGL